MFVPVVDKDQRPLMPTTPARARKWIKSGKATPFWKRGVFCVRLNTEPSAREMQEVAVGIDPGSKKEALTVKSEAHTFINVQADAVTWVSEHVKTRRMMRRTRRGRNCPHRASRKNRARGCLPPSTKARWQWKLRLVHWLRRMYPITAFVVEDIKARTKGHRRWDRSFSPLEVGKQWFYVELGRLGQVKTLQGYETKEQRDTLGLKKSRQKLSDKFEAHCVDSWVLANWYVGGHTSPDSRAMLFVSPLRFHRRQLHVLQPAKGGVRKLYGGTRSMGYKRGSWVKHPKWGLCYVGGSSEERITLRNLASGERLCRNAKPTECRFLCYSSFRLRKEEGAAARLRADTTRLKPCVPCAD